MSLLRPAPLIHLPHVWRAESMAAATEAWPTGHAALDAELPGGGWPLDGMVELLQDSPGPHVWQLLLPALAAAARERPGPVVLVAPPWMPFGPALQARGLPMDRLLWVRGTQTAAALWAAEQALRCAEVLSVLAWLPQARADALRRLHLAAQQRHRLLFVFRPTGALHESSPARLRLLVESDDGLQLRVLKRRGPPLHNPLRLPAHPARLAALLAARRPEPDAATCLHGQRPVADPQPAHRHALDRAVPA